MTDESTCFFLQGEVNKAVELDDMETQRFALVDISKSQMYCKSHYVYGVAEMKKISSRENNLKVGQP